MKTLLLPIAAILLSASTYAQNGFYLAAGGGAGLSNTGGNNYAGMGDVGQSPIFHYSARLTAGYQTGKWRLQTGIQYLTSGYELNGLLFGTDFYPNAPTATGTGKYRITYKHIGVPVELAYAIPLGPRFHLVPTLGLLTTYNLGADTWLQEKEGAKATRGTLPADFFKSQYNRISLWGTAAFRLEYKLSNRVSLFGGPYANYMVSNFSKQSPDFASISQRNYTIGFELGASLNI